MCKMLVVVKYLMAKVTKRIYHILVEKKKKLHGHSAYLRDTHQVCTETRLPHIGLFGCQIRDRQTQS